MAAEPATDFGLYHAARERSPEERGAYLQEACGGDDRLRDEVESLLRYDAASADFLERPAAVVGAADLVAVSAGTSILNTQLGPYTITAPLGAGGMGEVYAGEQMVSRDGWWAPRWRSDTEIIFVSPDVDMT